MKLFARWRHYSSTDTAKHSIYVHIFTISETTQRVGPPPCFVPRIGVNAEVEGRKGQRAVCSDMRGKDSPIYQTGIVYQLVMIIII